jgi:hypothetical protein
MKTISRPFSASIIALRRVHNVAMIIVRGRSLGLPHPFSFVFIRAEVAFAKNEKIKFSKRSEPNLGKLPGPPRTLRPGGKSVSAERTQQGIENNTRLPGCGPSRIAG